MTHTRTHECPHIPEVESLQSLSGEIERSELRFHQRLKPATELLPGRLPFVCQGSGERPKARRWVGVERCRPSRAESGQLGRASEVSPVRSRTGFCTVLAGARFFAGGPFGGTPWARRPGRALWERVGAVSRKGVSGGGGGRGTFCAGRECVVRAGQPAGGLVHGRWQSHDPFPSAAARYLRPDPQLSRERKNGGTRSPA